MKYSKPVWELMAECAAWLPDRFRFAHVQRWFDAHYPDINERTLRVHVIGLTAGPSNPNPYLAKKEPLFRRVEHGEYEVIGRAGAEAAPAPPAVGAGGASGDVLLVWHEREQRATPAPARDLFTSPQFAALRATADGSGGDWFVLTSEFGAVRPTTVVSPYPRRVGNETAGFRRAWSRWVVAKLQSELDGIEARTIEVCADDDVEDLVEVLEATGARVRVG
ncbi:MAG: hypothetical protein QM602_08205 [Microbacterium sp.]